MSTDHYERTDTTARALRAWVRQRRMPDGLVRMADQFEPARYP
jgi:hypothetical protein